MELFKIMLPNRKAEFSVIGVPNVATNSCNFQALMNGVPYMETEYYEEARESVLHAVEINKVTKENLT